MLSFENAPFTIQRLVELILHAKSQYKQTHKLMNGLEKLLSVTSPADVHVVYESAIDHSTEIPAASLAVNFGAKDDMLFVSGAVLSISTDAAVPVVISLHDQSVCPLEIVTTEITGGAMECD